MPQPIPTNAIQLQPQPDYWTRLLANLLQMGQLGFGVWQGLQQQQDADTNRMQATNQMMQGMFQWGQDTEFNYQALVAWGMDPKQARALVEQDRRARGIGRSAKATEERDLNRRSGQAALESSAGGFLPSGPQNPFTGDKPGPWDTSSWPR